MDDNNLNPLATDPLGASSAAALRELQARAQAAIAARRERASKLEADILARFETMTSALNDEHSSQPAAEPNVDHRLAEAQAEIHRLTAALEDFQAASQLERAAWESEREALHKERAAAEAERANFAAERSAWETERSSFASERATWIAEQAALEMERTAWEAERAAAESASNDRIARLARLEAEQRAAEVAAQTVREELRAAQEEFRRQLAELDRKLRDERAAGDRDRAELAEQRGAVERERDELHQKFELALEDVRRFRARVAELEQELARRPTAGEVDSAELVGLRVERDALTARVEQLERAAADCVDVDADQQRADLQRRFEMAVEDVRELKNKNAQLEAQLAGIRAQGGTAHDGGMDWESQKRRLLAALEDNPDLSDDPAACQERATIESTIEITDAVVADKDRLIEELRAQLAAAASKQSEDVQQEQALNALIDADEVIAQHRKNMAQLEQELEAKLRAAELELSVERAKIARNRAELEELRIELESQKRALGTSNGPPAPGAPRRRWLSKLGLTGEDGA